jgi:restriction endonuclease S subunit
MVQNYQKIGNYISVLDNRNADGGVTNLMGISIDKCYIPSVANVIGTDLHNYKVIRRGQFACSLMQVSRDQRIPLAMYAVDEPAIMSPAYVMFEVNRPDELLPEYLELWFKRAEFDREASFYAVGGVRGSLDWEDFCKMKLPIPPILEQKTIVRDYQVITDRIKILRRINSNLETQACTIIASKVGMPILLNKSNEEISKLSEQNEICAIEEYCLNMSTGATPSRTEKDFWTKGTIPWLKSGEVHNCCIFEVGEHITEKALNSTSVKMQKGGTVVMAMYGATAAQVGFLCIDATTNQAICALVCSSFEKSAYLYFSLILSQREIFKQANGGAQDNLSKEMIEKFKIIKLPEDVIQTMGLPTLLNSIKYNTCELSKLKRLSELIVGKMQRGYKR